MVLRALHLCSGYGGFELALRGTAVTVCHVERDSYAAAVLVARMAEQRLDQAPIWSDLETFDGTSWRGRADLITAGFPCQPFSSAGKRGGVDDDRWLWPSIARIVREVGPRYVFLENVPQLVRHGLPYVLDGLATLGFDAEWGLLAASAIGAPHKRERIWIVAHAASNRSPEIVRAGHCGADIDGSGNRSRPIRVLADTTRVDEREPHHEKRTESRQLARVDIGGHRFPPRRDDVAGWSEWDGPQPAIRRGVDGAPVGLADALHLGGNGLVPQCATEAWRQLTARLNDE